MARRLLLKTLSALAMLVSLALPLAAQDRATLVADSVTVQSGNLLIARGHVEVFFQGQRLTAEAITYDRLADRLTITGPIRIEDGKGNLFMAEQADLSAGMTEGLLTSARLVLARQLQMTAAQILRAEGGRITALRSVAASSCTVCRGDPTPLWEIRAREVVHDAEAQQIYFSDATLRFAGLPVLYLPMLRVPDPTLGRATGFLIPKIRSTTSLGTGIKLPYFITLGKSRDLTVTPYLTARGDRTLELGYRQAFAKGDLLLQGAVTRDGISTGATRGYLSATGQFDLGRGYELSFRGVTVSDRAYLVDYGISDEDRLLNQVELSRIRRDLSFSARLIGLRSLREGESNATLPTTMTDLGYERRFTPPVLGGVAALRLDTHGDYRTSALGLDSDGDGTADGRDLARASVSLDWRRSWVTTQGLEVAALAQAGVDSYRITQDADFAGSPSRAWAAAGAELRWPLVRLGRNGAVQTLEPVAQLVLATPAKDAIPNGDSTLAEFDEAALFALDRLPGADAMEPGARLNLGVTWTSQAPEGWSYGLTAGRVLREAAPDVFSGASGLDGLQSDWLVAGTLASPAGFRLASRMILDDGARLTRGELRLDLDSRVMDLAGGYEYLREDALEGREDTASELVFAAGRELARNWRANLSARYDLRSESLATAGLELDFRNECIDVTLSLKRSYAASSSLRPTTDLGLSVELLGFGGGTEPGPARTCRR